MYRNKSVTAVILAAGSSTRMGINVNKVYISTGGRLVVQYSLLAFDSHPFIDDIVIVTRPEDRDNLLKLIESTHLTKPSRIVFGGDTRKDSVYNSISGLGSDIVIIHDGARPLIRERYITQCIKALSSYDGSIVAVPVTDRICRQSGRDSKLEGLEQPIYAAQTPQCFYTRILRSCHEKHRTNNAITDDSCLLELEGYTVGLVAGDTTNIKITTPMDVPVAGVHLKKIGEREAVFGNYRKAYF